MEKTYICAPALLIRGGKAYTREGAPAEDPISWFASRAEEGFSMGFFLDESEDELSHEAAIGLIRRYTKEGTLPVMAGGRTKRLEDVKKYIYAGAKAALLREDDPVEMAVYDEAIRRFGPQRIGLLRQGEGAKDIHGTVTLHETEINLSWDQFKTGSDGLLPCIVQDAHTGQVLMMAYMNEEAFLLTCRTGRMTYYSRSRSCLWLKGETSGHYQYVKSLSADCDRDTLLAQVEQVGNACHTGAYSCFFRPVIESSSPMGRNVFTELEAVIANRKEHPKEGSYTSYLFDKGLDKILKKVGEEATELVIAAKNPDPEEIKYEAADLLYHLMVLLAQKEVAWRDVTDELANR
ncbi:MAG: bifunctional phosphoribosyl-AMP cyclohydrolase/phosphoribosyl-ATP diphosphatase HisIE [Lachnospiraceae bacterium]|nr:bifunctional phosphoribosyl-AMP cyclohydrolase/phosphoribosyl-ATP diphosphatase HisIE [Lachnospiraceae bacterium]